MSGVWKRSYGRPTKAPPDERGGNRHGRPNTTAPHPDSTLCSHSRPVEIIDRPRPQVQRAQTDPTRSLVAGNRDGEKCSRAVVEPGTASDGIRGKLSFVGALWLPEVCQKSHPRSTRHRAHHSVQTGHDGGQLVEQAGGRPCQSSMFRFIPSIEIIPAGRGPVPRTDSTPPQAKRWSLR